MMEGLLEKIKSRGYWRVNFRPVVDSQKLPTMKNCREIIEKNSLSLRGWNYPYIPRRNDNETGAAACGNYYEAWIQWQSINEFWRIYKSGQFLHYFSLREDWFEDDSWYIKRGEVKPGTKLNVIGSAIYTLTEIYEFLTRLVISGLYDEGVEVNISLNNTKDRELWVADPTRAPFVRKYSTGTSNIVLRRRNYSKDEVINNSENLALDAMHELFDNFEWESSVDILSVERKKLLSGKV